MKIEIELTEEQLALIIQALEIEFRFMMRQGMTVADQLAQDTFPNKDDYADKNKWNRAFEEYLIRRECAETQVNALHDTLYGRYRSELPKTARRLSDMWSAFRHLQWSRLDVKGYDVRSGDPFQMSDWEMIKIKEIENEGE